MAMGGPKGGQLGQQGGSGVAFPCSTHAHPLYPPLPHPIAVCAERVPPPPPRAWRPAAGMAPRVMCDGLWPCADAMGAPIGSGPTRELGVVDCLAPGATNYLAQPRPRINDKGVCSQPPFWDGASRPWLTLCTGFSLLKACAARCAALLGEQMAGNPAKNGHPLRAACLSGCVCCNP